MVSYRKKYEEKKVKKTGRNLFSSPVAVSSRIGNQFFKQLFWCVRTKASNLFVGGIQNDILESLTSIGFTVHCNLFHIVLLFLFNIFFRYFLHCKWRNSVMWMIAELVLRFLIDDLLIYSMSNRLVAIMDWLTASGICWRIAFYILRCKWELSFR